MNNKLTLFLLLIVLFVVGCAVTAVTFRPTVDTTTQTLVNHITQPDPLGDVMAVRQEAGQSGKVWATVGMVLAGLVVIGGVVAYLYLKPRMDKQKRLLLRAQRRGNQPARPSGHFPRMLPQQDVRELSPVQRPRLVQPVPEWEDGTYD